MTSFENHKLFCCRGWNKKCVHEIIPLEECIWPQWEIPIADVRTWAKNSKGGKFVWKSHFPFHSAYVVNTAKVSGRSHFVAKMALVTVQKPEVDEQSNWLNYDLLCKDVLFKYTNVFVLLSIKFVSVLKQRILGKRWMMRINVTEVIRKDGFSFSVFWTKFLSAIPPQEAILDSMSNRSSFKRRWE